MKKIFLLLIIGLMFVSCTKENVEPTKQDPKPDPRDEYKYMGVLPDQTSQDNLLKGSRWVITKWTSGFFGNYVGDTIIFTTNYEYDYKGNKLQSSQLEYRLYTSMTGSNMYDLILYGLPTISSSEIRSSQISENAIKNGLITTTFLDQSDNKYIITIEKI